MAEKTISFVGTDEIKQFLEELAKQQERSVSFIIRQIIQNYQERYNGTEDKPAK